MKAINMLENAQIKMIHYSVGHLLPGKFGEPVFRKMDFLRKANKKIPIQLYNLRERHIKTGEYIFHENEEEGQNSYMVLAGNFQIRKTVRGHTLPLLNLLHGDLLTFFTEIRKIRLGFDLCVQTKTEGSLVLLDRELFLNLARANHDLFNSLFESILLNLYVQYTILT